MSRFDVLSRDQDVLGSYALEASAGTGKTFAIENLLVRLLVEGPLALSEILVVTFTRAAARELRWRVHGALSRAVRGEMPDYRKDLGEVQKRLERALFCFEEAPIFTIHGFCGRMLTRHCSEWELEETDQISEEVEQRRRTLIRDYLREVNDFRPAQWDLLVEDDVSSLVDTLIKVLDRGMEISSSRPTALLYDDFQRRLASLTKKYAPTAERVIDEYAALAAHYNKVGEPGEIHRSLRRVAELIERGTCDQETFDALLWDQMISFTGLVEGRLKKKPPKVSVSDLMQEIHRGLAPLVAEACHKGLLLARLAAGCRNWMCRVEQGPQTPDDLLRQMALKMTDKKFAEAVASQYRAVIIDEFQDTDGRQWEIFQRLRSAGQVWTYLVGDPKQSIYSFRSADVYTYLQAKESIGRSASLDTNYRSAAPMIAGLNALFAPEHAPGLFPLPLTGGELVYTPVRASMTAPEPFADGRGAIHCLTFERHKGRSRHWPDSGMEEELLFPSIAREIGHLYRNEQVALGGMAVLIKDRHQARRLQAYLERQSIPASCQRSRPLSEAPLLLALIQTLEAVFSPHDLGRVKIALASPFFGVSCQSLLEMPMEQVLPQFYSLGRILNRGGFTAFLDGLLATRLGEESVMETLLANPGGEELYQDLQRIAEWIGQQGAAGEESEDALLHLLSGLFLGRSRQEGNPSPVEADAVAILTTFASKGLE